MVVRHTNRVTVSQSSALTFASLPRPSTVLHALPRTQTRNATFLRRPRRPYTFSQLVTLSDGSTYMHRTTSPLPVYKSTKDTRNTPLWNPSSEKLMNIEADEAGRLRAFREKFGRGWDARDGASAEVGAESSEEAEAEAEGDRERLHGTYEQGEEEKGGLMDLISEYALADGKQPPVLQQQKVPTKQGGKQGKSRR